MIATISTQFNCSEKHLWSKINQPQSLQYVASPILSFIPINTKDFDNEWTVGKTDKLKLFFLKFIPFGIHTIKVMLIDKNQNRIETHESNLLSPIWNHTISFNSTNNNKLKYTDQIEIKAGLFTFIVWMFSQIFYRHRQRKWKQLLKK